MAAAADAAQRSSEQAAAPARTRVDALDVLRGAAILGILLYNVADFTGFDFIGPAERQALPASGLDPAVAFVREWLVQGKFYSLFSLLFGIGIALQLGEEAGAETTRRVRRRLAVLLAIGTAHGVFLWFGDILQTYAVLGFGLLWFRATRPDRLLRWAVALLALPIVLYGVLLLAVLASGAGGGPPAGEGGLPAPLAAAVAAFEHGSYREVIAGNVTFTVAGWLRRLVIMSLPRIFGMFLLGLWLVRSGWLSRVHAGEPPAHETLARVWRVGLAIGLPLAATGAWLGDSGAPRLPTPIGWLEVTIEAVATPALALAYAAGLVRLQGALPWLAARLAVVGRMALTSYLTHSIVGVALGYGIGLGLWGKVALAPSLLAAAAFYVFQAWLSGWWLRRAAFGPAEWVWRQATYGRRLPLFR
jgi:uncharacterized protein